MTDMFGAHVVRELLVELILDRIMAPDISGQIQLRPEIWLSADTQKTQRVELSGVMAVAPAFPYRCEC